MVLYCMFLIGGKGFLMFKEFFKRKRIYAEEYRKHAIEFKKQRREEMDEQLRQKARMDAKKRFKMLSEEEKEALNREHNKKMKEKKERLDNTLKMITG